MKDRICYIGGRLIGINMQPHPLPFGQLIPGQRITHIGTLVKRRNGIGEGETSSCRQDEIFPYATYAGQISIPNINNEGIMDCLAFLLPDGGVVNISDGSPATDTDKFYSLYAIIWPGEEVELDLVAWKGSSTRFYRPLFKTPEGIVLDGNEK